MAEYPNPFAPPESAEPRPKEVEDALRLADPFARFVGRLVDGIFMGLCFFGAVMFSMPLRSTGLNEDLVGGIFIGAGLLFYNGVQIGLILTRAQSVGKVVVGTRIERMDGLPLGFLEGVFLRSWIPVILSQVPCVGSLFSLADGLAVLGVERRCLHDQIAGTRVVQI
jgi:uncharacterized RDD family membrane protein YckC